MNWHALSRCYAVFVLCCILTAWGSRLYAADFLDDSTYDEPPEASRAYDPLEPVNRAVFHFNDTMYLWVIEPVAQAYSYVVPADIRGCIDNFFYNLGEPIRSVNCLLEGRFRDSGRALSRFFINTICGVFGLGDPATREFDLPPVEASLGQTLASWGIGDGFYLVIPLFGPSTLRDATGAVGDGFAFALYTPWHDDLLTGGTVQAGKGVNAASLHLGEYEEIRSLSIDPYIAIRNGYFQMRNKTDKQARTYKKIDEKPESK